MKYFNIKTSNGIETIDSVDRNDYRNFNEYKKAVNALLKEYRTAYQKTWYSRLYISKVYKRLEKQIILLYWIFVLNCIKNTIWISRS